MEFIEKDIKLLNDKKIVLAGGNGGYVMPKIFCLNFDGDKQKQQE